MKMKLYRVRVDVHAPGGDYIVMAESEEEAIDFVRPSYTIDLDEDDVEVEMLSELWDLKEEHKGVLHEHF